MAAPDTNPVPLIPSPEEEECVVKETLLAELDQEAANAESELAAMRAGLQVFEEEYLRVVKPCITEMEELKAEAEQVEQEIDEALLGSCTTTSQQGGHCEPSEMKTLFREVARNIHPDLASNEPERLRRDIAMAAANEAYANGDPEKLRRMLQDWKADPSSVQGDDVGARLIRLIRKIARTRNQLAEAKRAMRDIRGSDLYFLRQRADRAAHEGRDLLQEMRGNLERQLTEQRARVDAMQAQSATSGDSGRQRSTA